MSLAVRAVLPERGVDLSLTVADGETLALIGPNGAGKSTVLSLIAGALRPVQSEVSVDGRVLTGPGSWVPPHRRRVTTLSQDPVLFPHLTARANVVFALRAQGASRAAARREAEHWLARLGLAHLAERRPAALSGGQAQRVAIARALAAQPRLLLLDEPMAALDIDVALALREQLGIFLAQRTAVVVTHDVLDALTLADRIAVLEDGRLVEHGRTDEVLSRPRTAFSARFAGVNLVTGTWDGGALVLPGGAALPARCGLAAGCEAHAAFRPSQVRLSDTGLARTVRSLSPSGDLVRVRTEDIAADVPPQEISARRLEPGAHVHVEVPAEAVRIYPA